MEYRVQLTGVTGRLAEVRVLLAKRTFSELIDQADLLITLKKSPTKVIFMRSVILNG
jgi:hypothetical protein